MEVFSDSLKAWDYLRLNEADIIVTDVSMPGSGTRSGPPPPEKRIERDTPVVVLTGLHEASLERQVLDLGATDLLSKPIQPDELLARLRSALRLKQMQDVLKRQNERLEQTVLERTRQLQASRIEIIWRLAKAAEFVTSRRGATCSACTLLPHHRRASASRRPSSRRCFSPLHCTIWARSDSHAILHKPARLTDAEREIVKTHCEIGERS